MPTMMWIYLLGERNGEDIKVGRTTRSTIGPRFKEVNDGQNGQFEYVVLAGIRGTPKDETAILEYEGFRIRTDRGKRKEYIYPDPAIVEYVNWLRAQYFVSADGTDEAEGFAVMEPDLWLPAPDRRHPRPVPDPTKLVQDWDTRTDHLGGTAWSWMVNPKASIQDFFTPAEIVEAAREAMGGIDLDAAGHWLANRVHRIPDYFHVNRSAFENPWYGRVWLNPPYGNNAPWFDEIERYVKSGEIEQLCMLSPAWVFITAIARPVMKLASGAVLLSPTPSFWGNSNPTKTGTNQPHLIIYIGHRQKAFFQAFAKHGIPFEVPWDVVDSLEHGVTSW